jgi:hypothetical protein
MLEPHQLSVTCPQGEAEIAPAPAANPGAVETFGGKIFVRWDPAARVRVFGPVTYFIEFLKTSGLWESWVGECPLQYLAQMRRQPLLSHFIARQTSHGNQTTLTITNPARPSACRAARAGSRKRAVATA